LKNFKQYAIDDNKKVLEGCAPAIDKAAGVLRDLISTYEEGPEARLITAEALEATKNTEEW
jgi:hypothetical protein